MAEKQTRTFTEGDTLVSLFAKLEKADGSVPLLEGTVSFFMKGKKALVEDVPKVNGTAAIIQDPVERTVRYDWSDVDVDTVGDYYAWFVNTVGGREEHFPGQGHDLVIKIVQAE
jgi:hypothetical protein